MVERRVRLTTRQRTEIMEAWHALARAYHEARARVTAVLNEHAITPDTPGRLAVESDGALSFVLREDANAKSRE